MFYTEDYADTMSVALRKESVDRNSDFNVGFYCLYVVALRKESVDRNHLVYEVLSACGWSLSARRAWIEIGNLQYIRYTYYVALRKESVDRNSLLCGLLSMLIVALRKESVDRNIFITLRCLPVSGRSPQGERG